MVDFSVNSLEELTDRVLICEEGRCRWISELKTLLHRVSVKTSRFSASVGIRGWHSTYLMVNGRRGKPFHPIIHALNALRQGLNGHFKLGFQKQYSGSWPRSDSTHVFAQSCWNSNWSGNVPETLSVHFILLSNPVYAFLELWTLSHNPQKTNMFFQVAFFFAYSQRLL